MALEILQLLILAYCIVSWIPNISNNPLVRTLNDFIEPLLKPFRRFKVGGPGMMLDLAPLLALLTIWIIQSFVLKYLFILLLNVLV
jgi:YggT family protein